MIRTGLWAIAAILGTLVAPGCAYYRIELRAQNLAPADAIVVLGHQLTDAGEPKARLRNRVATGVLAYRAGLARTVILTGGKPRHGFTEAARMREIAIALGVPAAAILIEEEATSSVENAAHTAQIMARRGLRSALVVSNTYHLAYAIPVFRDTFAPGELELFWMPVSEPTLRAAGLWTRE